MLVSDSADDLASGVHDLSQVGVQVRATHVLGPASTWFDSHDYRVADWAAYSRSAQGVTLDDPSRARTYSEEQYLRSPAEMAALFADLPEAVANTVEIARRCSLEVDVGRVFLPDFVADDRTPPRELLERR